jgi:hypothetical protein
VGGCGGNGAGEVGFTEGFHAAMLARKSSGATRPGSASD